jgi:hypothetical protein
MSSLYFPSSSLMESSRLLVSENFFSISRSWARVRGVGLYEWGEKSHSDISKRIIVIILFSQVYSNIFLFFAKILSVWYNVGMNYRNHSPWLESMDKSIEYPQWKDKSRSDVCIIGAGIAWVATAYHLLSQTEASVTLVEAKKNSTLSNRT